MPQLKKRLLKSLLPFPVITSHGEYSMILSSEDDQARPTNEMIEISLDAIKAAMKINLKDLTSRFEEPPYFPDVWPGEHYKLLAAFIKVLKPKRVIEIGTSTGISSLSMLSSLPKDAKLITYDIHGWTSYPDTKFKETDFDGGRLMQVVGDLSDPRIFEQNQELLEKAEFIFIDVTHDGVLEKKLLEALSTITFIKAPYLLFDDIRVWTMLKMWREITYPKLDLTSFGHWSGTGLVKLDS